MFGQLHGEYVRKAGAADRLNGNREGEIGPVEQRLGQFPRVMGLVCGAFNEASEMVHELIEVMANSRVQVVRLREGRGGSVLKLATVKGQIRRVLSTAIVQANAGCLLSRMCQVGEGAGMGGKRNRMAVQEEESMRRESLRRE